MQPVSNEEMILAQFRTPDGTYNAWMCAECGFGPVDHSACHEPRKTRHESSLHNGPARRTGHREI